MNAICTVTHEYIHNLHSQGFTHITIIIYETALQLINAF